MYRTENFYDEIFNLGKTKAEEVFGKGIYESLRQQRDNFNEKIIALGKAKAEEVFGVGIYESLKQQRDNINEKIITLGKAEAEKIFGNEKYKDIQELIGYYDRFYKGIILERERSAVEAVKLRQNKSLFNTIYYFFVLLYQKLPTLGFSQFSFWSAPGRGKNTMTEEKRPKEESLHAKEQVVSPNMPR